jgi:hypothetical protein
LGQQAGLSVQREPQHLLQDGAADKPADVLFGSFYHGYHVTIVNPFIDIHKKIRGPDSSLQSAVTQKRQNYADRCRAAGKLLVVCASRNVVRSQTDLLNHNMHFLILFMLGFVANFLLKAFLI